MRHDRPVNRLLLRTLPRLASGVILSVFASTWESAAQAQSATTPNTADSTNRSQDGKAESLEAVTVTATRRREPSREVPVTVNKLSIEDLERNGARTLTDYLANQPGVDVKTIGGAGLGAINLRGVSTGDQISRTVGLYIDDVAFGSSSAFVIGATTALDLNLLDLNHIELLRGPQGTLYGAGSMGGLLKYVTNEPSLSEFSVKGTLSGSKTSHGGGNGTASTVVNIPLSEGVAGLRISLVDDKFGGYVNAIGPAAGRNINRGNTTGARISLLLQPISNLVVRLSATGQQIRRDGTDLVQYDVKTREPIYGDLTNRLSLREPYKVRIGVVSGDIEYDFGWGRFNSISSVQDSRVNIRSDYTNIYGPLLAGAGLVLNTIPLDALAHVHKQTQEFRLTSQNNGSVEWILGTYYTHETGLNQQIVNSTFSDAVVGPQLANAGFASDYIETAAFGDVTWKPIARVSLTGGMRFARDRQKFAQNSSGLLLGGATTIDGVSRDVSQTYLATASYAVTDTSNVYVRAANGYRPGGPNAVLRDPVTGQFRAPTTFGHDSLWSYEAGYKADLLDNALSIEAAVYDIEWKNIQQASAVNAIAVFVNAGKARIKGAELGTTYKPIRAVRLNASVAYIDGRLIDDAPGLAPAGTRLPNSPRFGASASADYEFVALGYASYVGAVERAAGERNAGFPGSPSLPNYRMPGYAMTDLHAGVDFGRWQAGLFVRNVFDRRAQLSASTGAVPLGAPVQVAPAQPRTVGATISASY